MSLISGCYQTRDHFANGKHYLIFLINLQLRSLSTKHPLLPNNIRLQQRFVFYLVLITIISMVCFNTTYGKTRYYDNFLETIASF